MTTLADYVQLGIMLVIMLLQASLAWGRKDGQGDAYRADRDRRLQLLEQQVDTLRSRVHELVAKIQQLPQDMTRTFVPRETGDLVAAESSRDRMAMHEELGRLWDEVRSVRNGEVRRTRDTSR